MTKAVGWFAGMAKLWGNALPETKFRIFTPPPQWDGLPPHSGYISTHWLRFKPSGELTLSEWRASKCEWFLFGERVGHSPKYVERNYHYVCECHRPTE